jgi:hypothetical protein
MAETTTPILPKKLLNKAAAKTTVDTYDKGNAIPKDATRSANQSIANFRQGASDVAVVRGLDIFDGTLSSAVFSYVEIACTSFKVTAYDTNTHQFSEEGTAAARSILSRFDTLYDYSKGYSDKMSLQSMLRMALQETLLTGGLSQELVLDKQRLPVRISTVPYETIEWTSRGDGTKYPSQTASGGDTIPLDIPTFFVCELHKHASKAYASTMLSPAINAVFDFQDFLEDVRATLKRSGHARLSLSINAERVMEAAPEAVKTDPVKLKAWFDSTKDDIVNEVGDLSPEDVLVFYDTVEAELMKAEGEKADYVSLLNAKSGHLATSLKSSPSILGLRINGSQSLSNTESLVFLKVAKGLQTCVEENLSRILTLAARLYGSDVYVKFVFDPINLRPDDELEAFKTMQQARIFQQLSEGFITDEEAAHLLGTGPRAPGAPPLSGTGFARGSGGIDATKASPNTDPQGAALQPDTPDKAGGDSQ